MGSQSEQFNIVNLFYESAKKYPEKTAIIYQNKNISFKELEYQVTETANYFLSKGIKKGDRAMVFIPMSIDLYRIVLALFRIGATAVFLDEWVGKKRMEECCKVANCKVFIGILKARIFSWFSFELRKIPIKLGLKYSKINSNYTFAPTKREDTALITFTTGSTGTPKAAKRTHGFLENQFNALIEKIQPSESEIDMPVLPIVLLINLGTGSTSVIADYKISKPNSLQPEKIIVQLKKHAVNRIIASPFFVKEISKYIIKRKIILPEIKKIFTGGAPVFPSEAETYNAAFKMAAIEVVYGSTEAEPISSINVHNLITEKDKILSQGLKVGKPDKSVQVKIIKIIDQDISIKSLDELINLELEFGTIGEIIVTGDHVLSEYFNNDQALKRNKIFIQEKCWHRTGDSGYIDDSGILFLTGRCATLIYKDTEIISPFIYENYFQTIDGVELGTILILNKKLTAIIELNDASLKNSVKNIIYDLDISFKDLIFIKRIPRDPRHNSKIDYSKLTAELARN